MAACSLPYPCGSGKPRRGGETPRFAAGASPPWRFSECPRRHFPWPYVGGGPSGRGLAGSGAGRRFGAAGGGLPHSRLLRAAPVSHLRRPRRKTVPPNALTPAEQGPNVFSGMFFRHSAGGAGGASPKGAFGGPGSRTSIHRRYSVIWSLSRISASRSSRAFRRKAHSR